MAFDALGSPDPPDSPSGQATPTGRRRWRPSSWLLVLLGSGLTTGLLTLAAGLGAERLGRQDQTPEDAPPGACLMVWVGSPAAAETHLRLANAGPEPRTVRLDLGFYQRPDPWAEIARQGSPPWAVQPLDPGQASEVVFQTPRYAMMVVTSSGTGLHASAEVRPDDGSPAEPHPEVPCTFSGMLP
jgi:hypothetical protein